MTIKNIKGRKAHVPKEVFAELEAIKRSIGVSKQAEAMRLMAKYSKKARSKRQTDKWDFKI
jgi:hypothetical protein